MDNAKVYAMPFAKVYPRLITKAERKGRTKEEADQTIRWLTGYTQVQLDAWAAGDGHYGDFFLQAPCLNPLRTGIKGSVCGIRVEDIEDPLMREIRYLDKLIDDLAKGKKLEKLLPGAMEL